MKANWRMGIALLLAATGLFCWFCCASRLESIQRVTEQGVTLWCKDGTLTQNGFHAMVALEETMPEPVSLAAWVQQEEQEVCASVTGRKVRIDLLLFLGEVRLVLPAAPVLAAEDFFGCLLDRKTAEALYGSNPGIGGTLWMEGKVYTVRGLLDSPVATIIRRPRPEETLSFPRVLFQGNVSAEEFILRHGLSSFFYMDNNVYTLVGGVLCAIAPGMGVLWIFIRLCLWTGRSREWPLRQGFGGLCAIGVGTAGLLLLLWVLPSQWIPSRWSDFSFWGHLFSHWEKCLMNWLAVKKDIPDLWLFSYMGGCLLGLLSAALFFLTMLFVRNFPVKDKK